MNTPRTSPLEGQPPPNGGHDAEPAPPPATVGGPKDAARKGVPSALLPDPHPHTGTDGGMADPTPDRPGIRICAPPVYRHHYDGARWSKRYATTPTAACACTCGHTRTATGQRAVTALVTEYAAHKTTCTGTPTAQPNRRAAA